MRNSIRGALKDLFGGSDTIIWLNLLPVIRCFVPVHSADEDAQDSAWNLISPCPNDGACFGNFDCEALYSREKWSRLFFFLLGDLVRVFFSGGKKEITFLIGLGDLNYADNDAVVLMLWTLMSG